LRCSPGAVLWSRQAAPRSRDLRTP
jgi:hypothetical protein